MEEKIEYVNCSVNDDGTITPLSWKRWNWDREYSLKKFSWIWYSTSLELLYHHYKYWTSDTSNCVLIDWVRNIIAVQYNWVKNSDNTNKWEYIMSVWPFKNEWIVYNNSKLLLIKSKKISEVEEQFKDLFL